MTSVRRKWKQGLCFVFYSTESNLRFKFSVCILSVHYWSLSIIKLYQSEEVTVHTKQICILKQNSMAKFTSFRRVTCWSLNLSGLCRNPIMVYPKHRWIVGYVSQYSSKMLTICVLLFYFCTISSPKYPNLRHLTWNFFIIVHSRTLWTWLWAVKRHYWWWNQRSRSTVESSGSHTAALKMHFHQASCVKSWARYQNNSLVLS